MLSKTLLFLFPGMLLVQCAPAVVTSVPLPEKARIQEQAEPIVHTQAELESLFGSWVEKAQNPINFRLDGQLRNQWRQLISETVWGEYARRCITAFLETGQVSLTLEYRDYVRLRAALRNAAFRSTMSQDEQQLLAVLEQKARKLLAQDMSDIEKLCALHDFLIQHSRYDAAGGGNIADILYGGKGSCEAYSAAMCVLLEIAGIPSRIVTGSAAGGPHAWNLVRLNGAWYHVDATWDDPVIAAGHTQVLSHAYFCKTDAEIATTHAWSRRSYPESGKIPALYYRSKGTYFTHFNAFWRAAMEAYRRGEPQFEGYLTTYGSPSQFQRNLQHAATPDTPEKVGWTGPESAVGTVIVTFGS